MKIQDQVCTIEQAKRLHELGVNGESYFLWGEEKSAVVESWMVEGEEDNFYSAFTVAEMGAMMGKGTNAACMLYDAIQSRMNQSHSFTICYSPQFLANCVIGLLEAGHLTPAEVNERLKS